MDIRKGVTYELRIIAKEYLSTDELLKIREDNIELLSSELAESWEFIKSGLRLISIENINFYELSKKYPDYIFEVTDLSDNYYTYCVTYERYKNGKHDFSVDGGFVNILTEEEKNLLSEVDFLPATITVSKTSLKKRSSIEITYNLRIVRTALGFTVEYVDYGAATKYISINSVLDAKTAGEYVALILFGQGIMKKIPEKVALETAISLLRSIDSNKITINE